MVGERRHHDASFVQINDDGTAFRRTISVGTGLPKAKPLSDSVGQVGSALV